MGRVAGASGNGDLAFIHTSDNAGTYVLWHEAAGRAVAARFRLGERVQTFAVDGGFVLAVFDDVHTKHHDWPSAVPTLEAWIDASGGEWDGWSTA